MMSASAATAKPARSISRWYEISGNPRLDTRAQAASSRPAAVSANPMARHSGQNMTARPTARNFARRASLQSNERNSADNQYGRKDARRSQRFLEEHHGDRGTE